MSMRRVLSGFLSVVILAGGLLLAGPAAAQAAQGCGGNLVGQHVYAGGYAQVDVYLEGGTNCLVNRTRGDSWGHARWMGVGVGRGSTTPACAIGGAASRRDLDCGNFSLWAGPVRVDAAHTCISFWAGVKRANGTSAEQVWFNYHCG